MSPHWRIAPQSNSSLKLFAAVSRLAVTVPIAVAVSLFSVQEVRRYSEARIPQRCAASGDTGSLGIIAGAVALITVVIGVLVMIKA